MSDKNTALANPVLTFLHKKRQQITRADLLKAIEHFEIEQLTFHYTGLDGHLRELNLPFSTLRRAEQLLALGERVDGSSLFKGAVNPADSDLYVIPKYSTVFLNPFVEHSLDFICRFVNSQGELAVFPPDNILERIQRRIHTATELELQALGELEFYLLSPCCNNDNYPPQTQSGYHAAQPFFKHTDLLRKITSIVQRCTGHVKYGHAEVGYIPCLHSANPSLDNHSAEQYEVEMNSAPIADMGDYLSLARWIIRSVAQQHGLLATFAPKLQLGMAGSGYHVHLELLHKNRNVMRDAQGQLSEYALRLIGGLTRYAQCLAAFGNTVAASYLRLVPNQEAPTKICWSFSNRSSLVRIPLAWSNVRDLSAVINSADSNQYQPLDSNQTVEFRAPDGSAHTYMLLSALAAAAEWGLTHPEALSYAESCRIEGDVQQSPKRNDLLSLPSSCAESASLLEQNRHLFEGAEVFPPALLSYAIQLLRDEKDEHLAQQISQASAPEAEILCNSVMHRHLHRH
ncbi:MAG: glutamine synthetase family protein [bacterium]|nr:glutamine synthetase family protein [bacterium]